MAECRSHALVVREPYGVWGGLTEEEREAVYQRSKKIAPVGAPAAASTRKLAGIA